LTQSEKSYRKIVIKVGSSFFCSKNGEFDESALKHFVNQLTKLIDCGNKDFVIVSSGAIALGMMKLKLSSRPTEMHSLMAVASIGQNILMTSYSRAFKETTVGQVLLTWEDFKDHKRRLNAKNTLNKLLDLHCVPIVNENDAVSTEEIKIGDNDRLSAMVAETVSADLLIILSDVAGLLDKDRKLINNVPEINSQIKALARPGEKTTSVGGMITKIEAAKIAMDSGIVCVIANGNNPEVISEIVNDPFCQGSWTVFMPSRGK
jgi:glutamate 5-kinase